MRYTLPNLVWAVKRDEKAANHGRDKNGYGGKVPTQYQMRYGSNKWRRVYAICYANNMTLYIIDNKQDLYLDVDTQNRLEAII